MHERIIHEPSAIPLRDCPQHVQEFFGLQTQTGRECRSCFWRHWRPFLLYFVDPLGGICWRRAAPRRFKLIYSPKVALPKLASSEKVAPPKSASLEKGETSFEGKVHLALKYVERATRSSRIRWPSSGNGARNTSAERPSLSRPLAFARRF